MERLNKQDIPQGQTKEDVKIRKKIIMDFYAQWITAIEKTTTQPARTRNN